MTIHQLRNVLSLSVISASWVAADPVTDYRATFNELPPTEKLVKWECDINGDGHNEMWLSSKSSYDKAVGDESVPTWSLYIGGQAGYVYCEELEEGNDTSHGAVIEIDLKFMYVGPVAEKNNERCLVTQEVFNPREGEPIARIFAYNIKDGHLVKSKLAEYNAKEENPLFNKYLAEGKRTVITPVEVAP